MSITAGANPQKMSAASRDSARKSRIPKEWFGVGSEKSTKSPKKTNNPIKQQITDPIIKAVFISNTASTFPPVLPASVLVFHPNRCRHGTFPLQESVCRFDSQCDGRNSGVHLFNGRHPDFNRQQIVIARGKFVAHPRLDDWKNHVFFLPAQNRRTKRADEFTPRAASSKSR